MNEPYAVPMLRREKTARGWMTLVTYPDNRNVLLPMDDARTCADCGEVGSFTHTFLCPLCSHYVHRCVNGHEWAITIPLGIDALPDERVVLVDQDDFTRRDG